MREQPEKKIELSVLLCRPVMESACLKRTVVLRGACTVRKFGFAIHLLKLICAVLTVFLCMN